MSRNNKVDIEKVDSKILDVVFGYIRDVESSLSRKHIATEIAVICLSYYHFDCDEYFANVPADYNTINSEKEISVENKSRKDGSAFGNVLIPSEFRAVYIWKFKILTTNSEFSSIGISTEYNDVDKIFDECDDGHYYSLAESGEFYTNDASLSDLIRPNDGYGFGKDNLLTMILDLHQRTLKYKCTHEDIDKVHFENEGFDDIACGPDIHYKMAISLYENDEKVQLISFRESLHYYYFDDDEYFANAHSDYLTMHSADGISIERVAEDYHSSSAFGNVLISSQSGGTYVWKFKILWLNSSSVAYIGISTQYKKTHMYFFDNEQGHSYEMGLRENGFEGQMAAFDYDYLLTMTLDLKRKTLKYEWEDENKNHLGDEEYDSIECGPSINYKLAICSDAFMNNFQLVGFYVR